MNYKELWRDKRLLTAVYVLLGVIALWMIYTIAVRVRAERANNTVEICVDFDQAVAVCQASGYPLQDFIARCQAIGAASCSLREETLQSLSDSRSMIYFSDSDFSRLNILDLISYGSDLKPGSVLASDKAFQQSILSQMETRYGFKVKQSRIGKYKALTPEYPQPFRPAFWNAGALAGFSPEKIAFIRKQGMKAALRAQNAGNPRWLGDFSAEDVSAFIWDGRETPGYPGRENELLAALINNGIKFADVEFAYPAGSERIERKLPYQLVRGHIILPQELNRNFSADFWNARWERAIKERGIRFLLFGFWESRPVEENISYLRKLAQDLKSAGFSLGQAAPPRYPSQPFRAARLFFTACAGIILPLIGLYVSRNIKNPFKAYFMCNAFSLAGALLITAFLSDALLMQKIVDVPGIKAVMLAPVFISVFLLFPANEISKALQFRIQLKHVLIVFGILLCIVILLLRTGNYNLLTSQPEYFFRDNLEGLFGFRPRTKEFLIGQPLLFLGFAYRNPWLLLAGMIGQVSLINTFLHAHSPVLGSLVRTFHGLWLGLLIGYAVYLLAEKIRAGAENRQ